jgi:hypothetical protein
MLNRFKLKRYLNQHNLFQLSHKQLNLLQHQNRLPLQVAKVKKLCKKVVDFINLLS